MLAPARRRRDHGLRAELGGASTRVSTPKGVVIPGINDATYTSVRGRRNRAGGSLGFEQDPSLDEILRRLRRQWPRRPAGG